MGLRRWLDPPAVRERKRLLRARPRAGSWEMLELGCVWPLALLLGVAIAVGVLVGLNVGSTLQASPREAVVRVIDDGAPGGPKVLATAIVTQQR